MVADTFVTGFWRVASAHPDRIAVIDGDGTTTTFGELLATSRALAHGLRTLGVERGDGVAAVLPNHRSFLEVAMAALETGVYFTPVNAHLVGTEIAHVIQDSEAKVLVVHEALGEACRAAVAESAFPAERRFAVGDIDGFRPYSDLQVPSLEPPVDRSPGVQMMYTSGTTGKPKGVRRKMHDGDPDEVHGAMAEITCRGFGIEVGGGSHLVCGPLYHAGPYVGAINSLHVGKMLVLMDRWTPELFLELVERHAIDSTQMVPTMFHRVLAIPQDVRSRYDVSSLRSVFHTGAPCPREVKQQIMDWWGPVVYETYGGTEGAATIATPRRWLQRPGTVGKAIHGVAVHILDDDGNALPPGERGEVWIESLRDEPSEYFKDPEKTAQIRRGRMVTLGDVGYLDDDAYLFLCDRKVDMIISGGVNIYPAEVEAALLSAPEVADAIVFGVPDDEWGEQVKAIVELRPGSQPGPEIEDALIRHCAVRIARFKLPRSVEFVDALPRLPNGKIEKRRLRDPYWADRERAI